MIAPHPKAEYLEIKLGKKHHKARKINDLQLI
jgi:hypothetical protein